MADKKLKVSTTLDTSRFDSGVKNVKNGLRDLNSVGQGALSAIGDALGVNVGQVQKFGNAVGGALAKLGSMGSAGEGALSKIAVGCTGAAGALAALGIGVVIAAFKELNAEADNFRTRVEGINIAMAGKAYRDTYKQVLHDLNADTGKWWAETGEAAKNVFARAWSGFKESIKTGAAAEALIPPLGLARMNKGMREFNRHLDEAGSKAKRAAEIASRLADIQKAMDADVVRQAKLNAEIAKLSLVAYDTTASTAERQKATAGMAEKINAKYAKQNALMSERSALITEMNNLAGSTMEEMKQDYDLQAATIRLGEQRDTELRSLLRLQKQINGAASSEAEARMRAADQMSRQLLAAQGMQDLLKQASAEIRNSAFGFDVLASVDTSKLPAPLAKMEQEVSIVPKVDTEAAEAAVMDLTNVLEDGLAGVGESIGALVGDLLTGGDAWENFSNAALSGFADMAVAVGKIAISTGLATEAVRASLAMLGGWGAVAAGVALVAIGTAVKAGLRNVASGNFTASPAVANGSYRSSQAVQNADLQRQTVAIEVTGTLEGRGDALVAVINSNRKKLISTT